MDLYIYDAETKEVVAIATGKNNEECEEKAADQFGDTDYYGWTYSPAFGFDGGLIENSNAVEI